MRGTPHNTRGFDASRLPTPEKIKMKKCFKFRAVRSLRSVTDCAVTSVCSPAV